MFEYADPMEQFTAAQQKDLKVLINFVRLYCALQHTDQTEAALPDLDGICRKGLRVCTECRELVEYALKKRRNCPLDPKPSCKQCRIHCYSKEYRARIREIMAFSGKRMIMRGRLDYIWHYLF